MSSAAPRWIAALVAGLSSALIMYGVFLSDGRPFPYHQRVADVQLAFRMIPVELLVGLLVGAWVYWLFGRPRLSAPRPDVQERMVERFAHRRGGTFTLGELETQSPLSAEQARQVVAALQRAGRLRREGDTYRLP
ncbi:hypothetical protein DKM44_07325 [Deinococcus irradiatisoli]|uniref:Uncharacterized protein n=1 Tax=Deinococcus irradiatisoli TaxID=2202254 RepID=A0A2Z3JHM4_9DEIO|nr:hypothetical protein [Deinococcus irradiatisoli]AWN23061.1 hypothetical protein DKM44_07325 [Deinococcus irradiatisoli]